jgi:hypothetical protein
MLLFANDTADWIAAIATSLGVFITVIGLLIAHRLVVRHDTRKAAIDLFNKVSEHSYSMRMCQKVIANKLANHKLAHTMFKSTAIALKIRRSIDDTKEIDDKHDESMEILLAEQRNLYSLIKTDIVLTKILFPEGHEVVAETLEKFLTTSDGKGGNNKEVEEIQDKVISDFSELFTKYERMNWNVKTFWQYIKEAFR